MANGIIKKVIKNIALNVFFYACYIFFLLIAHMRPFHFLKDVYVISLWLLPIFSLLLFIISLIQYFKGKKHAIGSLILNLLVSTALIILAVYIVNNIE